MIKGSGNSPINLTCQFCKRPFTVAYKFRDQKYCSLRCASLSGWNKNRKSIERICKICSVNFREIPSRIKEGKGKYCSKKCYWVALKDYTHVMSNEARIKLSNKRIGNLNPAFLHGKSESMSQYKSQFNKLLKEKVLRRDNNVCRNGHNSKILHVHHIDHDKTHNIIENLVSLCPKCHKIAHIN